MTVEDYEDEEDVAREAADEDYHNDSTNEYEETVCVARADKEWVFTVTMELTPSFYAREKK
jgi:hypothetical protein